MAPAPLALLALLLAADPPARTDDPPARTHDPPARTYDLEAAKSTVRYHIVHKFHDVTGTSGAIEGRALVQPDGTALVMVRVPMASFDSGERNRDADMRETVEAQKFPFVVFKGVLKLPPEALPASRPVALEARVEGEVDLHGVKNPVAVPLALDLSPDGAARARGSFEVSLESFGIKRPSLLFVKIDDACKIDVDLRLRELREARR